MIDLVINVGFGIVGVVGFALAVVQYRQAQRVTDIFENTLEAIARNAEDFAQGANSNEVARTFARQVQRQCYALIRGGPRVASYFVRFFPAEYSSSWATMIGRREARRVEGVEPASFRLIMTGEAAADGEQWLIYGPYETLAATGLYRVTFNIIDARAPDGLDPDVPVMCIDVNGANEKLAERYFTARDLGKAGEYSLNFRYRNLSEKLEYRVSLLHRGVCATLYDVTLRRIER